MQRIKHKRSSHLTLWLGLSGAVAVLAGFLHYSSILAEKKRSGTYNYLRPVPSESVLHARLKDEQYRVAREGATETAFQNEYWNNTRPGIYVDLITNYERSPLQFARQIRFRHRTADICQTDHARPRFRKG